METVGDDNKWIERVNALGTDLTLKELALKIIGGD